jgi:putative selenium metabolism protein SsnA
VGEVLKGGTLIEFDPPLVEKADLRVDGSRIMGRGPDLVPLSGDEVTDVTGRYLIPGLVVAHTHLYSVLARGSPKINPAPTNFVEMLQRLWWKLDRALDLPAVELSATVGAMDALCSGTTTVFDHHASPSAIEGSLFAVKKGVDAVGLRGVLCYEVTDRNGAEGRNLGLRENENFLVSGQNDRFRGLVGGHASFTLDDFTLNELSTLARKYHVGVHIHMAEDLADELDALKRGAKGVVDRLNNFGIINADAVLAHATRLQWEELSAVQNLGAWLVHNARSNMNNAVGYANPRKFGHRVALGTDGIGGDVFAEAQTACLRALDASAGIDILKWISGGHKMASAVFGVPFGSLRETSIADLVVLDYATPTPVTTENLPGHLLYGISASAVDSVMIDGVWRLWARQPLAVDRDQVLTQAMEAAPQVWKRMAEIA